MGARISEPSCRRPGARGCFPLYFYPKRFPLALQNRNAYKCEGYIILQKDDAGKVKTGFVPVKKEWTEADTPAYQSSGF
jgi:hypothetical protein